MQQQLHFLGFVMRMDVNHPDAKASRLGIIRA